MNYLKIKRFNFQNAFIYVFVHSFVYSFHIKYRTVSILRGKEPLVRVHEREQSWPNFCITLTFTQREAGKEKKNFHQENQCLA